MGESRGVSLKSAVTDPNTDTATLEQLARKGRWLVLDTVAQVKAGHVGGPLSAMDFMVALFFKEMHLDAQNPKMPERDRFVLSKGHSAIGLYSVMALRGFFPVEELATFDKGDSRLQGHPDSTKLPGIEIASGSLGQGLSYGLGTALGALKTGSAFTTWVIVGDGELQEGNIWESVIVAPKFGLDNLVCVVDANRLGQYGPPQRVDGDTTDREDPWQDRDLAAIFESFGWETITCADGNDMDHVLESIATAKSSRGQGKPIAIIAHTVKGKGASFAEGQHKWHNGIATSEELDQAHMELFGTPRAVKENS